jgi:hypothetical protein
MASFISFTDDSPFELARRPFKPQPVKLLFITEQPQPVEQHRFFYFEQVRRGDSMFLELMKVLFPEEVAVFESTKALRAEKAYFLNRFKEEGYYLLNASEIPQPNTTQTTRRKALQANLPLLLNYLEQIISTDTPIILISATTHEACYQPLTKAGYKAINEHLLPYPNSGQQINFRRQLRNQLRMREG